MRFLESSRPAMLRFCAVLLSALCIVICTPTQNAAQEQMPKDIRQYLDSLHKEIHFSATLSSQSFAKTADSLMHFTLDSLAKKQLKLQQSRIDTLTQAIKGLQQSILQKEDSAQSLFRSGLQSKKALLLVKKRDWDNYTDLADSVADDAYSLLDDARDDADDTFQDTLDTMLENEEDERDAAEERAEKLERLEQLKAKGLPIPTLNDKSPQALQKLASSLSDDALDSLEFLQEHATRLEIEPEFASHSHYRARDNSVAQFMFLPTLTFTHQSGLFLSGSAGYFSQSNPAWDMFTFGGGYTTTFGGWQHPWLELTASYTHFWFSETSVLSRADVNNNAELVLDFTPAQWHITLQGDHDFSSTLGESTLTASLAYSFEMEKVFGSNTLSIEPTVTGIYGQQDERLVTRRLVRTRRGTDVTRRTVSNQTITGMMGYLASLPVTFTMGNFSIEAHPDYVVPVNVLDHSTANPFWNMVISLAYTIR